MDENKGFYFFASYMEAAELLEPVEYKAFISALLHYAIEDDMVRADALEGTSAAFFALIRPSLDKSKARAAAGRKGGSVKQTPNKTEANVKQNESKTEAIKDKGLRIKDKGQGIKDISSLPLVEKMIDSSELEAAEPSAPALQSPEEKAAEQEIEFSLLLVDNTFYHVTTEEVEELIRAFPAVDVRQQLRVMELWCKDPANRRRKTRSGIRRFIRSWLSREQDKGRASPAAPTVRQRGPGSFRQYEQRPFDPVQAEELIAADIEAWEVVQA